MSQHESVPQKQFLILIRGNNDVWQNADPAVLAPIMQQYFRFNELLQQRQGEVPSAELKE
ncbi:hypothetical protein RSal33209_2457 [Renibacterium salmoninarum ATCC 33209]|uniref:Uncharacterized protein n=1 Tax=Renibacterium salmoninarum (strain ATCC 33209 / DSM 20767 / JCM 11484 / NBRC 15589 / NCIMB 2235) TaxID=288705 RepID=A9WS54_RENSM|nr:hypothetical protein [Renibacterium salmoninarum]ABY24183.1 hypothetical protein RSal33209_2457 [Renibacterium salmoninarum ATCC 33209]